MPRHRYITEHRDEFVEALRSLVAQPSVSSTGEGMDESLEGVVEICDQYGFDSVDVFDSPGFPAVIADAYVDHDPDNPHPTVVIYGHYDVQPVDPEKWDTDPFDPAIESGPDGSPRMYGRGAGDNKGQWFAHLCAVRALRETDGLPVNVTLLLDGEGEIGSPNLEEIAMQAADRLDGELLYWADGNAHESGRPQIWLGSRGMVYVELTVSGPDRELHSGHNSPVRNPAWSLVQLLATMKDADGNVTIDGFYDNIRPATDAGEELLETVPYDEAEKKRSLGVTAFELGPDESFYSALVFRPSFNISGISGGDTGSGRKAIVPSDASVKIDIRLVPDQDPDDIFAKVERHVHDHAPSDAEITVEKRNSVKPNRTPPDHPVVEQVSGAVTDAWETDPIIQPNAGGSGPDYVFDDHGLPVVLVTYGNADENQHGPNENIAIDSFTNGIEATANLLTSFTE